jgi:hypothetical protein
MPTRLPGSPKVDLSLASDRVHIALVQLFPGGSIAVAKRGSYLCGNPTASSRTGWSAAGVAAIEPRAARNEPAQ